MKTEFTLGPWELRHQYYIFSGGKELATVWKGQTIAEKQEDEANARLIAAAPDLFSALQSCIARHDAMLGVLSAAYDRLTDNDMIPANHKLQTWIKQAQLCFCKDWQADCRAALAKATGKD